MECSERSIRFSASSEPVRFDGKLCSLSGGGGGEEVVRAMMKAS